MSTRSRRMETGIAVSVVFSLVLLAGVPFGTHWLREPVVKANVELPLAMPHKKHSEIPCQVCHHDYADKTGSRGMGCILCHKSDHPKLVRSIMGEFHDFCKGCHAEEARTLAKHGPVNECSGCHYVSPEGRFP